MLVHIRVDYVKTPSPGIAEGSVAMTAIYNGRGIRMGKNQIT
jgi:hypothetical protein